MKIVTEEEYNVAIEHVEIALLQTEYWQENLDYWSRAVEEYEDIHYPMDKPSLWTRIKFRLSMKYKWLSLL